MNVEIYLIEKKKGRIYKSEDIVKSICNMTLSHNEEGAPILLESKDLFISISDTKNYFAMAMACKAVGLDIEEVQRVVKPSVSKRFSKSEQEYLGVLNEDSNEWKEEFLSIWTKKEAYMKLMQKGLRMGLSSFSVLDGDLAISFRWKKLVIGLSSFDMDNLSYDIKETDYDAPFEQSCLDSAAYLLESRSYSEGELSKKLLAKGYSKEDIALAIEKLKGYGYLDDEALAKALFRKFDEKGMAGRRIEQEMMKKGIEKGMAKYIVSMYTENSREKAFEIAKKMPHENDKEKAKIARKLSNLGYEATIIYDILGTLN